MAIELKQRRALAAPFLLRRAGLKVGPELKGESRGSSISMEIWIDFGHTKCDGCIFHHISGYRLYRYTHLDDLAERMRHH